MASAKQIGSVLIVVVIALIASGGMASAAPATANAFPYPWDQPGCPCATVLHGGPAAEAGLVPQALDDIDGTISRMLVRRVAPGAVVLVARRGVIAMWKAYGYASMYKSGDYAMDALHPLPMPVSEAHSIAMKME